MCDWKQCRKVDLHFLSLFLLQYHIKNPLDDIKWICRILTSTFFAAVALVVPRWIPVNRLFRVVTLISFFSSSSTLLSWFQKGHSTLWKTSWFIQWLHLIVVESWVRCKFLFFHHLFFAAIWNSSSRRSSSRALALQCNERNFNQISQNSSISSCFAHL